MLRDSIYVYACHMPISYVYMHAALAGEGQGASHWELRHLQADWAQYLDQVDRWCSSSPGSSELAVSSEDNLSHIAVICMPSPILYFFFTPYVFIIVPVRSCCLLECTHLFNYEQLLPYIIFAVLSFPIYIMVNAVFSLRKFWILVL